MSLTKQSDAYIQEFERRCVEYGIDDEYHYNKWLEEIRHRKRSATPVEREIKGASKICKVARQNTKQ